MLIEFCAGARSHCGCVRKAGDLIEPLLIRSTNMTDLLRAGRDGGPTERRDAAYELCNMAAVSNENRRGIVLGGGALLLVSLALEDDDATQDYALEAVAELCRLPEAADHIVDAGGMRCLLARLKSAEQHRVTESARALMFITQVDKHKVRADCVCASHCGACARCRWPH